MRALLGSALDPWALLLAGVAALVGFLAFDGPSALSLIAALSILAIRSLAELATARGKAAAPPRTPGGLTEREFEIAGRIAHGFDDRELAESLELRQRELDGHIQQIVRKLRLRDRSEIGPWYRRYHRDPDL